MNEKGEIRLASDSGIIIRSFEDISNALGACMDATGCIFTENELTKEFFDLRSGLAGELFQKFINYNIRVAIVLANYDVYGKRFRELVSEHTTHNMIRFFHSKEVAEAWLHIHPHERN